MSQTRIKIFSSLQLTPCKLKTYLSIALVCAPFYTNANEFCLFQSKTVD
jgi:hypothetical protein